MPTGEAIRLVPREQLLYPSESPFANALPGGRSGYLAPLESQANRVLGS